MAGLNPILNPINPIFTAPAAGLVRNSLNHGALSASRNLVAASVAGETPIRIPLRRCGIDLNINQVAAWNSLVINATPSIRGLDSDSTRAIMAFIEGQRHRRF